MGGGIWIFVFVFLRGRSDTPFSILPAISPLFSGESRDYSHEGGAMNFNFGFLRGRKITHLFSRC